MERSGRSDEKDVCRKKNKPAATSQKSCWTSTVVQWIQQVGICGKSVAEETQRPLKMYIN